MSHTTNFATLTTTIAAALALAATATQARADAVYWTGNVDSNWRNGANWLGGRVPNGSDLAIIPTGTTTAQIANSYATVASLWVQPGASVTVLTQFVVSGNTTLQGTMYLAGTSGLFMHGGEVDVTGSVVMWGGSAIERTFPSSSPFIVTQGASLVIPTFDTVGVTLGTTLYVRGLMDVQSTQTIHLGSFALDQSPNSYVVIEQTGLLRFQHSGRVDATVYPPNQPGRYIVNEGTMMALGTISDAVVFTPSVAVLNDGTLLAARPDVYIQSSFDMTTDGLLQRGVWACRDYGRVFFPFPLRSIGTGASVRLAAPGSTIIGLGNLNSVEGSLWLEENVSPSVAPASGQLVNRGSISISSSDRLSVYGAFAGAPGSSISVSVAGAEPGTHGEIDANSAMLAGGLSADVSLAFAPSPGLVIPVVQTSGSLSGQFDSLTVTGDAVLSLSYDALNASLISSCPADFNQDGGIDGADVDAFFAAWEMGSPDSDVNQDGGVDGADVDTFFRFWEQGGC